MSEKRVSFAINWNDFKLKQYDNWRSEILTKQTYKKKKNEITHNKPAKNKTKNKHENDKQKNKLYLKKQKL